MHYLLWHRTSPPEFRADYIISNYSLRELTNMYEGCDALLCVCLSGPSIGC